MALLKTRHGLTTTQQSQSAEILAALEAHLNSPGKLGGNWSWRAADGFDTAALAKRILAECAVYCRTEPGRKPGVCLAV